MKRFIALMLTVVSIICLYGCSAGNQGAVTDGELMEVTTTDEYPLDTDVELRWWLRLPTQVTAFGNSLNDTNLDEYLYEATGVKVNFEHPVAGSEDASMNILLSSDDLPDIITWDWNTYPGGSDKAISDGIVAPMDSYIDKVLPNLKKVYDENPEYKKMVLTPSGHHYAFPVIIGSEEAMSYISMIIRKDLLDKSGLDYPETQEEWEKVLYTFKEMGVKVPLYLSINNYWLEELTPFGNFFDFIGTFYHDENGKIHFGPYEQDKFTPWVELMTKWYSDGILDPEFADGDNKRVSAMITTGDNGAAFAPIGGSFGAYLSAIPEGSGINYQPTTVPTKNKGEIGQWWQRSFKVDTTNAPIITQACKNKEIAARFLDFGYSDAGYLLYNFGKEGDSYEMVNGTPTFIPELLDPALNGNLTVTQALSKYNCGTYSGPFVKSLDFMYQFYPRQEQRDALKKTMSNALDYKYPNISLSTEESKKFNDIMTPINTYREETIIKIISGKMPLSELDNYYSELKRLGIEEAIQMKQAAYDKYMN